MVDRKILSASEKDTAPKQSLCLQDTNHLKVLFLLLQ